MQTSVSRLSVQGAWEVKRRFELPGMNHERDAQVVSSVIRNLPGVCGVLTDSTRAREVVVYDVTRLDYKSILAALEQAGFPAADTRWNRLKSRWLQSLDETGRENANAPAPVCCSNPKGIAPVKRR